MISCCVVLAPVTGDGRALVDVNGLWPTHPQKKAPLAAGVGPGGGMAGPLAVPSSDAVAWLSSGPFFWPFGGEGTDGKLLSRLVNNKVLFFYGTGPHRAIYKVLQLLFALLGQEGRPLLFCSFDGPSSKAWGQLQSLCEGKLFHFAFGVIGGGSEGFFWAVF